MFTLYGRTCVFAGATGEIGKGAVRYLAEGGMNVVLVTHNEKAGTGLKKELEGCRGQVEIVSNQNGDAAAIKKAYDLFGSVDVLISTTGGMDKVQEVGEITAEQLNEKLEHQVTQPFMMVQAALPLLEKSKAGRIILATTAGAQDGFAGENLADSIARGGVISMVYGLARQLAKKNITVNAISRSGMINDHEPLRKTDYDVASIQKEIPVGKIGTATDFGAMTAYLASEEAGFVTGQILGLTGGIHIG